MFVSAQVPFEWTKYESQIHGESFGIKHDKFLLGTRSVRIGIRANWEQTGADVEFAMKNLVFSQIKYLLH